MPTHSIRGMDKPPDFGKQGSGKKSHFGKLGLKQLLRATRFDWQEYQKQREQYEQTLREFLGRKEGA